MRTLFGALQRTWSIAAIVTLASAACTHVAVRDCPDSVLGDNTLGSARLRTSHFRVMLKQPGLAAARFAPYALMSAYAYRVGNECADPGNDAKRRPASTWEIVRKRLAETTLNDSPWELVADRGMPGGCEDDQGLMFQVWQRKTAAQTFVVLAFRGTSGDGDWVYGNLWPLTQLFVSDNQISGARKHATPIIERYVREAKERGEPPPRFVTTGHSLGGGLAQHVLYTHPQEVEQAIAFDPSSITGFTSVDTDLQRAGCACLDSLGTEARIIRVYQTYEILTNLRIFHKTFFPPERHVQEVRFPFKASLWNPIARHSMQDFAANLHESSGPYLNLTDTGEWYESPVPACTAKLKKAQAQSCSTVVDSNSWGVCPQ